jgi:hypothetical protein
MISVGKQGKLEFIIYSTSCFLVGRSQVFWTQIPSDPEFFYRLILFNRSAAMAATDGTEDIGFILQISDGLYFWEEFEENPRASIKRQANWVRFKKRPIDSIDPSRVLDFIANIALAEKGSVSKCQLTRMPTSNQITWNRAIKYEGALVNWTFQLEPCDPHQCLLLLKHTILDPICKYVSDSSKETLLHRVMARPDDKWINQFPRPAAATQSHNDDDDDDIGDDKEFDLKKAKEAEKKQKLANLRSRQQSEPRSSSKVKKPRKLI